MTHTATRASEMPQPVLPRVVTTYDILKSLAVIIMVIDHIGSYFYPDDLWWRAVGRIGFPVWFFLIGYARSRRIDYMLIGGALILIAADALLARQTFPLNALVTMLLLRVGIDPIMRWVGTNDMILIVLTALFYLLFPFTNQFWEYGTLAFIFAICGYLARHKFQGQMFMPYVYGGISLVAFVVTQHGAFGFPLALDAFNAIGSAITMMALFFYLPRKEKIGFSLNNRVAEKAILFMGSRTLEIYVVHLVVFKILRAWLCACTHCSCRLNFDPLSLIS